MPDPWKGMQESVIIDSVIKIEELKENAKQWSVPYVVVEKDYVYSWIIRVLSSDDYLKDRIVLCGGLSLRKIYYDDYRYSDDFQWTAVEDSFNPEKIKTRIGILIQKFSEQGELDFSSKPFEVINKKNERGYESYIINFYYSLKNTDDPIYRKMACILTQADDFDTDSINEKPIKHNFSDASDFQSLIKVYSLEILLAKKLTDLIFLHKAIDLWDASYILRHSIYDLDIPKVRKILERNCSHLELNTFEIEKVFPIESQINLRRDWDIIMQKKMGPGVEVSEYHEVYSEFLEFFKTLFSVPVDENYPKHIEKFAQTKVSPLEIEGDDFINRNSQFFEEEAKDRQEIIKYVKFAQKYRLKLKMKYKDLWRELEPYSVHETIKMELGLFAWSCNAKKIKTFLITPSRIQALIVDKCSFRPRFPITYKGLPRSKNPGGN
ncbi:nucleotidyl transferase AbiEii/AbiGii toxin family protein [Candidatus Riflebacteria bacterium]